MKRLLLMFVILALWTVTAFAQTGTHGGMQGHEMMPEKGKKMPMMHCPGMQQMSGGMMREGKQMPAMQMCPMMGSGIMQDMMTMMMDMMDMQEKMLKGVKAADKKKMMTDIAGMKKKLQEMIETCKCQMHKMMQHHMTETPAEAGGTDADKPAPPATEPHKH